MTAGVQNAPDPGVRFEFGRNWKSFLQTLDEPRILAAEKSLKEMLDTGDLKGKRFLDAGCGSGLFSLAARRLGAAVHSFDADIESVECTQELKRRFFSNDSDKEWTIEKNSILDLRYLNSLKLFDIVYSWGVLHHTGNMKQALENITHPVAPNGKLFIAIYNDQGRTSRCWSKIKRIYNLDPKVFRHVISGLAFIRLWGPTLVRDLLRGRPGSTWKSYGRQRGMSPWHDVIDWVGGYPFEVAKPEGIFDFYHRKGFTLTKLKTCGGGHGCNEFVFENQNQPDMKS
jgi:2-polyprenyl-3-methyl-5-hydroxy-6-metoxy-1,4-benzoquinol methylase